MTALNEKKYYLRMGSNSEKSYIYKTASLFSGVIVKANYFESSKGLLSGIFLKLNSIKSLSNFIIDPITYAFFLDPNNAWSIRSWKKVPKDKAEKVLRDELRISENEKIPIDWIREIDKPTNAQLNKVEVYGLKRAYRKLADIYFNNIDHVKNIVGKNPVNLTLFSASDISIFIKNVLDYQINALSSYYTSEKFNEFTLPSPQYILSPYTRVSTKYEFEFMSQVWDDFEKQVDNNIGGFVFLSSIKYLKENYNEIIEYFINKKVKNIFYWFDDYDEDDNRVSTEDNIADDISPYVDFVIKLSVNKSLFNFYGGGFSPLLLPFGLTGIINGPGYGLDRKVEPVQGGLPSAQYYIPTLRKRETVFEAYDLINTNNLGKTKIEFHSEICNCPICNHGIKNNAYDMLQYYGEQGPNMQGKDGISRRFPTKEALERTVFHFILSRLIDYKWAAAATKQDVIDNLLKSINMWSKSNYQLKKWYDILIKYIQ